MDKKEGLIFGRAQKTSTLECFLSSPVFMQNSQLVTHLPNIFQ